MDNFKSRWLFCWINKFWIEVAVNLKWSVHDYDTPLWYILSVERSSKRRDGWWVRKYKSPCGGRFSEFLRADPFGNLAVIWAHPYSVVLCTTLGLINSFIIIITHLTTRRESTLSSENISWLSLSFSSPLFLSFFLSFFPSLFLWPKIWVRNVERTSEMFSNVF